MKPPIIVIGDDLEIFESVGDAERYIEAPDVHKGQTVAYDSEGRLLELRAPGQGTSTFLGVRTYDVRQPISISDAEPEPSHQSELSSCLRDYLHRLSLSEETLSQMSLAELIGVAIERCRFTK